MSGKEKHPLEIFRESGGQLGQSQRHPGGGDAPPPDVEEPPRAYTPPPRPESSLKEFELRLNLNGTLVLVLAVVVLLAVAHIYGYQRGRGVAAEQQNNEALALGERIENGSSSSAGDPAPGPSGNPWGVIAVTYAIEKKGQVNDLAETLREKYGISGVYPWDDRNGKIEVIIGKFARKDDPELIALRSTLRSIRDYPYGQKAPFTRAEIKQHPEIPPY